MTPGTKRNVGLNKGYQRSFLKKNFLISVSKKRAVETLGNTSFNELAVRSADSRYLMIGRIKGVRTLSTARLPAT
eukprot:6006198-Amphidinium_carterae.1